jgi:hypothetical protein
VISNDDFAALFPSGGGGGAGGSGTIVAIYENYVLDSHGNQTLVSDSLKNQIKLGEPLPSTMSIREVQVSKPNKVIQGIRDLPTLVVQMGYSHGQNLLIEKYTRFATHIEFHDAEPGRYRIYQAETKEELEKNTQHLHLVVCRTLAELMASTSSTSS